MANISRQEFTPLDLSGKNYLTWITDVDTYLVSLDLGKTIIQGNDESSQNRAKAMIFIRHHLGEGLKNEYLTVKDPFELWDNLKDRFDHLKMSVHPGARFDWLNLRLQDFKTVTEFNSAMFRITSQLKLCGDKVTDEDMLEKTYSTFHISNMLLQQQYREKGFKKYSELIQCLLVAEQNNQLLLRNHESRPTGASPFPEANWAQFSNNDRGRGYGRGRDQRRGRRRGRGRGKYMPYNDDGNKQHGSEKPDHGKQAENKARDKKCFRCGKVGHWARNCHTSDHFVQLFEASKRNHTGGRETNLVSCSHPGDDTANLANYDAPDMSFDTDTFMMVPGESSNQVNLASCSHLEDDTANLASYDADDMSFDTDSFLMVPGEPAGQENV